MGLHRLLRLFRMPQELSFNTRHLELILLVVGASGGMCKARRQWRGCWPATVLRVRLQHLMLALILF
eukprot:3747684-Amphidinium_carterae.1